MTWWDVLTIALEVGAFFAGGAWYRRRDLNRMPYVHTTSNGLTIRSTSPDVIEMFKEKDEETDAS